MHMPDAGGPSHLLKNTKAGRLQSEILPQLLAQY